MKPSTRRQFFGNAAIAGAGAFGAIACRTKDKPAPAAIDSGSVEPAGPVLRTFTTATFATLSAVCERLLPRDEDPGAIDLGVPGFIDQMVATPELAPVRDMLSKALPSFDREARKRFGGKAFHEATPEQQDEIIASWQHGRDGSQRIFDVLMSLTLEGAFGDPKYGGNVGGQGFKMIGFKPDPPLRKMDMGPGATTTPDSSAPASGSSPGMPPMPGMNHGGAHTP